MTHISPYPVKKGETYELRVEKLAFGGRGIARVDGYTVFVERGIPGQLLRGRIVKRRKGYAEARIEEVLETSPRQVEPRCSHFGLCGGCMHQHLAYDAQLEAKREQVRECLTRLAGLDLPVAAPLAAADAYEYRNKMEYSFSNTRWLEDDEIDHAGAADRFGLGLHIRGRYDRVLDLDRCHLQVEAGSLLLGLARESARKSGLPAYSTRTHDGFWRFLMVREGVFTGERMVVIITHTAAPGSAQEHAVEEMARVLTAQGPPVTSVVHGQTARKASVAFCESLRTLYGEPVIRERLLDITYEISPNSFFQTNSRQAERLFGEVMERGAFQPDETVWDLYCGAGAISLPLARRVKRVVGMELVPEAVEAARRNAAANGIDNVEFVAGDMKNLLGAGGDSYPRPDAVIVDPPRDGVHASVLATLAAAAPGRIVYVSCNPATLARDMAVLVEAGYEAGEVQPVDMFPHTGHIECVTVLHRGQAQGKS